jgi:hypothetical protein
MPRFVSIPATQQPDHRPRQVAVQWTAICLGVSGVTIAMTAAARRLRRRPDTVPHD